MVEPERDGLEHNRIIRHHRRSIVLLLLGELSMSSFSSSEWSLSVCRGSSENDESLDDLEELRLLLLPRRRGVFYLLDS